MSTTINVTVDGGGLPAKNRQQTAANRQAFVQGQSSQQAAQQGADQRAADRRAAGLDPATGRPLPSAGASSRLPRIEQEPAANRQGGISFAVVPYLRSFGVRRYIYSLDGQQRVQLASWSELNSGNLISDPGAGAYPLRFLNGSDSPDFPSGLTPEEQAAYEQGQLSTAIDAHQLARTSQQSSFLLPAANQQVIYVDLLRRLEYGSRYESSPGEPAPFGYDENDIWLAPGIEPPAPGVPNTGWYCGDRSPYYSKSWSASAFTYSVTCYRVSAGAVQVINTPANLLQALKNYVYPEFLAPSTASRYVVIGASVYEFDEELEEFVFVGACPVYAPYDEWQPTLHPSSPLSPDNLGLLPGYGIFGGSSTTSSPAIYDLLLNPEDVLSDTSQDPVAQRENYEDLAAALTFNPRVFVSPSQTELVQSSRYYEYIGPAPETADDEPDPLDPASAALFRLRRAQGRYFPLPELSEGDEGLILFDLASDLGNSSYCQTALSSLGF